MAKKKTSGSLTPGQRLRAELKRLGLDQVAATKTLGYSRQSINNVVNDRQKISRAMAAKLGRLTGHSSDYWLRNSFPRTRNTNRGATSSFFGLLNQFEILHAIKDGLFSIDPFLEANVGGAFLGLTLANIETFPPGKRLSKENNRYIFPPGGSAKLRTKEHIKFPRDYVGRISATESLSMIGLITPAGFFIASEFDGPVDLWAINFSSVEISLKEGDLIANLEIMRI